MASRSKARLLAEGEIDVGEELEQLERLMDRVKTLYEQHFMGIQRMAPETLHRQIERRMLKLTQHQIRNTALRFRFTTISQKFGSYNTYWRRTMRAIEQGRYHRHLQMAARKRLAQGKDMPEEMLDALPKRLRERILKDRERVARRAEREAARAEAEPGKVRQAKAHRHEVSLDDMADDFDFDAMFDAIKAGDEPDTVREPPKRAAKPPPIPKDATRPKRAAPPKPEAPPKPKAGMPPGMTENQTRSLFDKYVKAKKLCGESTDKVTYNKLLRTLNKQAPAIMKKYGARSVDFNVVIKDDKVILKAKPKK